MAAGLLSAFNMLLRIVNLSEGSDSFLNVFVYGTSPFLSPFFPPFLCLSFKK